LILICLPLPGTGAGADELSLPGVRAAAFSPDGKLLAAGTGLREGPGQLTVWDAATHRVAWTHREAKGVCGIAFAPDSRTLAIAFFDRTARLLDAAAGRVAATVGHHDKEVRGVAFSPDGRTLATASYDHTVKLWDLPGGGERAVLRGHTDMIFSVAFSPDGAALVSAGGDGVRLWEVAGGKEKHLWRHGNFLTHYALFTPDGRWVLTGGWDGTVRVWDTSTGQVRAKFQNLGGVDGLAFSPATRTMAVCGTGRDVQLFGLDLREPGDKDRERIRSLLARFDDDSYEVREATGRELWDIGLLAEGELRRAAAESPSAEVRLRARRLRQELLHRPRGTLRGHGDSVEAVAFTPDGKRLASGGKDGTVRVWDVASGKEEARLVPPASGPNPR
jgi:WD40 repeat protein